MKDEDSRVCPGLTGTRTKQANSSFSISRPAASIVAHGISFSVVKQFVNTISNRIAVVAQSERLRCNQANCGPTRLVGDFSQPLRRGSLTKTWPLVIIVL